MKVLFVSNQYSNSNGVGNPIMYRMRDAFENDERIKIVDFIPFTNTLDSLRLIRKHSKSFDLVHVHFGGVYALLVWFYLTGLKCKKLITFHGTDIHAKAIKSSKTWKDKLRIMLNQKASFMSILCFDRCGFVSQELMSYIPLCLRRVINKRAFLQPLGVDYSTFVIIDKKDAQDYLNLEHKKYVLFSDVSNSRNKRKDIAEEIVKALENKYTLLYMSGVKPGEVPYYINACDFALLTSDEEGSPNIIREVLSLNKRFFSVDVGDAKKQLEGLINSAIISRNPIEAAIKIKRIMSLQYSDNTREQRRCTLDFVAISGNIINLYQEILTKKK